jgi:hypothetical protein
MASRDERRRGGGGRLLGVGLLAGIVALVIAYLRGCIPGLGVGGSPASAPAESTKSTPASDDRAAGTALRIVVDGDRCRRGTTGPVPCAELCAALASEAKDQRVEVDGTIGTHASVDALKKCLDAQGFRDVVVRAE